MKATLAYWSVLLVSTSMAVAQPEPPEPVPSTGIVAQTAAAERILDTRVVEVTLGRRGPALVERQGVASEPGTWRLDDLPGLAFGPELEVLPADPGVELGPLTLFREEGPEEVTVESLDSLLRANLGRPLRLTTERAVWEGMVTAVLPGGESGVPLAILSGGPEVEAVAIPVAEIRAVETMQGELELLASVPRRRPAARLVVDSPGKVRLLYRAAGAHWSPRYRLEVLEAPAIPEPPAPPPPPEPGPAAESTAPAEGTSDPEPLSSPNPPEPPAPPEPRYGMARLTLEAEVTNGLEDWAAVRLRLLPGDRIVAEATLDRGDTARLPLTRAEIPFQERLLWRASSALDTAGHWRFAEGRGGVATEAIATVLEMRNGGRTPWPNGPLVVVQEGGLLRTNLPETPGRSRMRIVTGNESRVMAQQREEVIDQESGAHTDSSGRWDRLTLTAELAVRNESHESVEIVVEKSLVGEFLEADPFPHAVGTLEHEPTDPNPRHLLEWTVIVPRREQVVLRYRYRLYARP